MHESSYVLPGFACLLQQQTPLALQGLPPAELQLGPSQSLMQLQTWLGPPDFWQSLLRQVYSQASSSEAPLSRSVTWEATHSLSQQHLPAPHWLLLVHLVGGGMMHCHTHVPSLLHVPGQLLGGGPVQLVLVGLGTS